MTNWLPTPSARTVVGGLSSLFRRTLEPQQALTLLESFFVSAHLRTQVVDRLHLIHLPFLLLLLLQNLPESGLFFVQRSLGRTCREHLLIPWHRRRRLRLRIDLLHIRIPERLLQRFRLLLLLVLAPCCIACHEGIPRKGRQRQPFRHVVSRDTSQRLIYCLGAHTAARRTPPTLVCAPPYLRPDAPSAASW